MGRGRPVGQSDILTEEELQRIMELPDRRTKQGARDYAVLLVLGNTPMRKGELVNLNKENLIDEGQNKFITYVGLKKKSKKPYWLKIPITNEVYDGIKRLESDRSEAPSNPLFRTLGKHGPYVSQRITPLAVDLIVEKYVKEGGINKRITPHSFRATYLTLRGGDPFVLQDLSGHDDIQSLMPYVRNREEKKREVALSFSFS